MVGSSGLEMGTERPAPRRFASGAGDAGREGAGREEREGRGEEEGVRGRTCRRSPPLCLLRDWEQRGEL